jgi:hypothetical protein
MILNLETSGIVLAGHWNRMIFTPEWVATNLFHEPMIEAEISMLPGFPAVYRHRYVLLEASSVRIVLRPKFNNARSLGAAEEMATAVLTALPNTPLAGVGINFVFVERNPPVEMVEIFNLRDAGAVARAQMDAPETKLVRKLVGEHGVMNFSLGYDTQAVTIEINYHTETPGPSAVANQTALAAVAGRVVTLRDAALRFLHDTYGLRLEDGDGDE